MQRACGLALMLAAGFTGCAISPAAYREMAREVSARNAARRTAALERLAQEGYALVEDQALIAVLADPARKRCQVWARRTTDASFARETARVMIDRAQSDPPRIELDVALPEACSFFVRQSERLHGADADGHARDFVRLRTPLIARTPDGSLVYIEFASRVISEQTVRVEDTCNEMPNPGPEPFEQVAPAFLIPRAQAEAIGTVELDVEREQLDYECTHVVE